MPFAFDPAGTSSWVGGPVPSLGMVSDGWALTLLLVRESGAPAVPGTLWSRARCWGRTGRSAGGQGQAEGDMGTHLGV